MNRRDSVIALLAAAMAGRATSARAQAQRARKPFVIALLPHFMPPLAPWLKIITDGLRDLGHIEGRDHVFYRSGVFYGPDYQLALDRVRAAKADLMLVLNLGYAVPNLIRQAVPYIDQILWRGVSPGDLPIQLPAKFEFIVNLKTASAIGIAVPPSILLQADEVIE